MKKLIFILSLCFITINLQAASLQWVLNLIPDKHKEVITLVKSGNSLNGKLRSGAFKGILKNGGPQISGVFRYKKRAYKFTGKYAKENKHDRFRSVIGHYCACGGTPNKSFTLKREKVKSKIEELKAIQSGNNKRNNHKSIGVLINAKTKPSMVTMATQKSKPSGSKGKGWSRVTSVEGIYNTSLGELKLVELQDKKRTVIGEVKGAIIYGHLYYEKGLSRFSGAYFDGKNKGFLRFTEDRGYISGFIHWDSRIRSKNWAGNKVSSGFSDDIKLKERYITPVPGKYRITVTHIYAYSNDEDVITTTQKDIYGAIGIRLKGKSQATTVNINSSNQNKNPRIWNVKERNAKKLRLNPDSAATLFDLTGNDVTTSGRLKVNKSLDFNISKGLANKNLMVNIQINLAENRISGDLKHGWKQRNLYVKNMTLGAEYYLNTSLYSDENLTVGFRIKKLP